MKNSNPITDILWESFEDGKRVERGEKPVRTHAEALQALYEAVKSAVPDEEMMQQKGDDLWSWNDCRAEFLTNLSLLFGVPLGNLATPKATNSQPQLADNPVEYGKNGRDNTNFEYYCPFCGDGYSIEAYRDLHIQRKHPNPAGISKEGEL